MISYNIFTIITGAFAKSRELLPNGLHVANGILEILQVTLQLTLLATPNHSARDLAKCAAEEVLKDIQANRMTTRICRTESSASQLEPQQPWHDGLKCSASGMVKTERHTQLTCDFDQSKPQ